MSYITTAIIMLKSRARLVGAPTVRAYVDKNYNPLTEEEIHRFDPYTEMKEFDETIFEGLDNYGDLCVLSEEEVDEIYDLWKELVV